jgi:Protein of unknown function (DUF3467)
MSADRSNSSTVSDAEPKTPKVTWDDSKMNSSYANVCNVTSTREEVVLFFGLNQNWQGSGPEVTVQLTERLILSPHAASRMHALLGKVLSEYESRFGALGNGAQG